MFINRYIGGKDIFAVKKLRIPYGKIYDYVKESNCKDHEINHRLNILALSETVDSMHAIKLSSLFNPNIKTYLKQYHDIAHQNNNKILIDAENIRNQEMINHYTNHCIETYTSNIFYKTYQMYRNDSYDLLKSDLDKYTNKNNEILFGIKLVRGAYFNEDKKSKLLFTNKEETDLSYNSAVQLLENYNNDVIIASHNQESCNLALKTKKQFKYAQLLGMNDKLSDYLLSKGQKVYKYIPYGKWSDSIPYLTRRLYENYDILKYIV